VLHQQDQYVKERKLFIERPGGENNPRGF
jgi:hypothetical protein